MVLCDNCGFEIGIRRFIRRLVLGGLFALPCPSCRVVLRAGNTTETLFLLITLGGGIIGGVLAIYAHERLGWTNADVLKFAIAAAVGGGSICGFVIWQLGDYTSRPRGEDEDFVEADRATRLRVLGLVIAPILLLLLARVAFKNAADQLLIMLPAWAAAWFGASICLLWVGIRVKRSGRWPPPGMRMAARTRIRRGKYAMWSRIVLVSAAGFATVAALAGLFAWHVTSQFVAEEAWLTRNHALVKVLTANYQPVSRVDAIPAGVRAALFGLMKDDPRLANPDERFNSTDVVDRRFPMRRLIVAGGLPTSWLVCYEHGGRGYVRHLVIFGVQDDRVESQFSGSVGAKVTSLRELRKAIREGHVSDNTRDASGHY